MAFRIHGYEQTSWWLGAVPPNGPNGTTNTWVNVRMNFATAGRVFGARYYQNGDKDEARVAAFWENNTGVICDIKPYRRPQNTGAGWCQTWFRKPIRIVTGQDYVVGILIAGGGYFRYTNRLTPSPRTQNGITFVLSSLSTSLNPWSVALTENVHAHGVDVLFQPD